MRFSTDNQKKQIAILAFLAGAIVAVIFYPKPESETFYKTTIERLTDTLYITSSDTVYIPKTKIKTEVLRDTILIDFKPQISLFKASFPFEYGSTNVSGEVLGEVLKMTAVNDYKLPVVNNTVTVDKVSTIVVKPKGVYLGASINSLIQPSANLLYLDNKYLFSYQFQPVTKIHTFGISKKLF